MRARRRLVISTSTVGAHPAQRVRCVPSMFNRLGVKVP